MPEPVAEPALNGLRLNLRIVSVVIFNFASYLTIGLPLAVLPGYVHDVMGFSAFWAGLVISLQYFATLLSRPHAGRYADLLGPKKIVVFGLGGCFLSGLSYLLAAWGSGWPLISLLLLCLGRVILGIGQSFAGTGSTLWGVGVVGSLHIGRVISWNGIVTYGAMAMGAPRLGILITLVGYFGLLFAITKFRDSGLGVGLVFALTGFMGYTLGPIISHYLSLPNGGQTVMMAMGGTAAIFLGLSGYALTTRKDFSFMGGFLMVGILLAFLAGLAAIFFEIPALSLTVSATFVLLMSGLILYETSNIIHGGETNYVMAGGSMYLNVQPLFLSVLRCWASPATTNLARST